MNGLHQAFIDAYQSPAAPAGERVDSTGTALSAPQAARGSNGRLRYRVDNRVDNRHDLQPHMPTRPAEQPFGPLCFVELSTWDTDLIAQMGTSIVGANVMTCLPEPSGGQVQGSSAPTPPPAPVKHADRGEQSAAVSAPAAAEPAECQESSKCSETENSAPFKPIWEVDRFAWPADVERIYSAEASYFAHAGQKLRDAAREGLRVLVITSARAGEGCTTLAMCLARAAAEAGVRVALMDADVRSPVLGQRMGVKFPHSWTDALLGIVPLDETAITSVERPITLLPLSLSPTEDAAPAATSAAEVIRRITTGLDLLIIDAGCAVDAASFQDGSHSALDAAIVVRDVRTTSKSETMGVATRLKQLGVSAVGIAENYAACEIATEKAAA
jgi:Mrp family chromosome partitioning ATPase